VKYARLPSRSNVGVCSTAEAWRRVRLKNYATSPTLDCFSLLRIQGLRRLHLMLLRDPWLFRHHESPGMRDANWVRLSIAPALKAWSLRQSRVDSE
jgi:hypothetical protein